MRSSHPTYATDTAFDETNLLPDAGLVPLLALAERAGLRTLLTDRLTVAAGKGAGHDAATKITTVIAGMAAGADSIEDLDVLRHGATPALFDGVKAPSTIGSHLRAYTFGHVRQLDAVASRFLIGLGRATGMLDALTAPGAVTYVDVDDTVKAMHGYAQQGRPILRGPVPSPPSSLTLRHRRPATRITSLLTGHGAYRRTALLGSPQCPGRRAEPSAFAVARRAPTASSTIYGGTRLTWQAAHFGDVRVTSSFKWRCLPVDRHRVAAHRLD